MLADRFRSPRLCFFTRPVLLLLLLAAGGCMVVNTHDIIEMPVAAAREQTPGTAVTVEGVVTVASGTFDAGFALQDPGGGIYVTRALGKAVKTGNRAHVVGFSGRYQQHTELLPRMPDDVAVISN